MSNILSEQIIDFLCKEDKRLEQKAINQMYKLQQGLRYTIKKKYNLSQDEVTHAYHDALISFIKAVRTDKFRKEAKLDTYFYSIFQNKCNDMIRKRPIETLNIPEDTPETIKKLIYSLLEQDDVASILEYVIKQLQGKNCQGILTDFYYYNYSMEGIAEKYGYKNDNAANTKKNVCMNELREIIYQKLAHLL